MCTAKHVTAPWALRSERAHRNIVVPRTPGLLIPWVGSHGVVRDRAPARLGFTTQPDRSRDRPTASGPAWREFGLEAPLRPPSHATTLSFRRDRLVFPRVRGSDPELCRAHPVSGPMAWRANAGASSRHSVDKTVNRSHDRGTACGWGAREPPRTPARPDPRRRAGLPLAGPPHPRAPLARTHVGAADRVAPDRATPEPGPVKRLTSPYRGKASEPRRRARTRAGRKEERRRGNTRGEPDLGVPNPPSGRLCGRSVRDAHAFATGMLAWNL